MLSVLQFCAAPAAKCRIRLSRCTALGTEFLFLLQSRATAGAELICGADSSAAICAEGCRRLVRDKHRNRGGCRCRYHHRLMLINFIVFVGERFNGNRTPAGRFPQQRCSPVCQLLGVFFALGTPSLGDHKPQIYGRSALIRDKMQNAGTTVHIVFEGVVHAKAEGVKRLLAASPFKGWRLGRFQISSVYRFYIG